MPIAIWKSVEVRQCPLGSGTRGRGPEVPAGIWSSRWTWDLELAVEVRQCPLESGARGGGPAMTTGIWRSRWKSGYVHWDVECEEEEEENTETEEEKSNSGKI